MNLLNFIYKYSQSDLPFKTFPEMGKYFRKCLALGGLFRKTRLHTGHYRERNPMIDAHW